MLQVEDNIYSKNKSKRWKRAKGSYSILMMYSRRSPWLISPGLSSCLIEAPYSPSSSEGQSVGRPDRPFVIQIGSVSAYAERQDKWLTCCVREAGIHATLPRGFLSRSGLRVLPFPPARRSLDFSLHYNGESERARARHAGRGGRGYSDKKFDPHRIFHRVSISSERWGGGGET